MTNTEITELLKKYHTMVLKLRSQNVSDFQEARSFLNKNRILVQKILYAAKTLRPVSLALPLISGGKILNNLNPLDLIYDPPYGLESDIYGHVTDVIEQTIGVVESDPDFASKLEIQSTNDKDYDIWSLIHPSIAEVSKKRIKDEYYADAVEAACKLLNARVREIFLAQTNEELDGAKLMRKAFSPNNPIICIASPASKSGQDTQQGYMDIFAGVMTGIRNPKAHDNETISKEDALRKLIMISLLMYKIDERIITE